MARGKMTLAKGNPKGLNKVEKKQVKKILRGSMENKYHDTLLSVTEEFGGTVYSISDVPQGDTDINRDGDQLNQRAVRLRYSVRNADATNMTRVILFRWKQDDTPNVTDILSATFVGGARAPLSPYHHDGRSRFTVLYDKVTGSDAYNSLRVRDSGWINLRNKKQYMNAGSTTSGSNKLYVLIITDSALEASPLVELVSRLTFTDA